MKTTFSTNIDFGHRLQHHNIPKYDQSKIRKRYEDCWRTELKEKLEVLWLRNART